MTSLNSLRRVATFAMLLSLFVVMLGAYTRLTHAGLGCPDWPGCYGRIAVPAELSSAQAQFPDVPIESRKAWTEMVHRYAAGTLVLCILLINFGVYRVNRIGQHVPRLLPVLLIALITFQALLGMWTVTLKLLPLVVMGHLLGGILIFSCLSYFRMQLSALRRSDNPGWSYWITGGMFLVFCQIALGGWVSSNYAGIACVGFPQCNGQWIPSLNFSEGFNLFLPIGANYQGGVLDSVARVTIQFVHRMGAVVVAFYILGLSAWMWSRVNYLPLRISAFFAGLLVLIQLTLGVMNVVYLLPLWIAVCHNGVAALLLGLLTTMRYMVSGEARNASQF